jgi:hypothetical protein
MHCHVRYSPSGGWNMRDTHMLLSEQRIHTVPCSGQTWNCTMPSGTAATLVPTLGPSGVGVSV